MPISFDFTSIKNRIIQNLSAKSEWSNFLSFSTVDNLISVIAQEMAYQVQYKEYLTNENWWIKARNKSSLLVESPVLGYQMPRKKGSTGTLRVSTNSTFSSSYGTDITIPKYFEFSNGSIFVVSSSDNILSSASNYVDISAKQGEYKYVKFTAQGIINENKIIEDNSVDNDLYDLYVNDVLWTRVDSLYSANSTDMAYTLTTDPSLTKVELKFGNDIFGKKLNTNDVVLFRYISTNGFQGNIYSTNNITTVESQAFDSNGLPVTLYVTNTTAFTGGIDYLTLEQIRESAPQVFQTGDRASSKTDYEVIIEAFSFISKSNVWGAYETLKDQGLDPWTFIPTEENVVHVAALNTSFENLTTQQKNDIVDGIHNKNDPTDIIQFENVNKISLIFIIEAFVKNTSYSLSGVKANIEIALTNNYSIQNIDFNENIYYSDFVALIDSIDGVRNHNSYILVKKVYSFEDTYIFSFNLPVYPILSIYTKAYIKLKTDPDSSYILLANCNSDGIFVGQGGYNTDGSQVDLTTGAGALIVNSGLSQPFTDYDIMIKWRSEDNNMIIRQRYDIFEYVSSEITMSYPII